MGFQISEETSMSIDYKNCKCNMCYTNHCQAYKNWEREQYNQRIKREA